MIGSFTAGSAAFTSAIGWAAKWVESRPISPIHGGILLSVADGRLTVGAFSENATARALVDVDGGATGNVVVSGRLLAELAGTFPDKPVTVEAEGEHVMIGAGRFKVTLPAMEAEDYPVLREIAQPVGTITGDALAAAVARVRPMASRDDARPIYTCVHLDFGESALRCMASDGLRAVKLETPWQARLVGGSANIPAGVLSDAAKSFAGPDEIRIGCDGSVLSFASSTRAMTVRLITLEYPAQLNDFIAYEPPAVVGVVVADLREALKRAAVVSGKGAKVRLDFRPGLIGVSAAAGDSKTPADSDDEIECDYDGEEGWININSGYLTDALVSATGARVWLAFYPDKYGPVLVTTDADKTYRQIVMPIKKH